MCKRNESKPFLQKTDAAAVQLEPRKEKRFRGEKYQRRRYLQMAGKGGEWFEQKGVGKRQQPAQLDYQGIVSDPTAIPS